MFQPHNFVYPYSADILNFSQAQLLYCLCVLFSKMLLIAKPFCNTVLVRCPSWSCSAPSRRVTSSEYTLSLIAVCLLSCITIIYVHTCFYLLDYKRFLPYSPVIKNKIECLMAMIRTDLKIQGRNEVLE